MNTTEALPLARRYALHELPGWWRKTLVVPPGKVGVAVNRRGAAQTWEQPGRYRVLGALARLRGEGVGMAVGWVPGEPFAARVQAPYLLSGDDRLVTLSAVVLVQVSDPVRFFRRHVLPAGSVHYLTLLLDSPEARAALSEVTGQYLAEDLSRGVPHDGLNQALEHRLAMFLAEEGLQVQRVRIALFWEPDKQAEIEAKMLRLREQLQQLALEGKIQEAEAQERLADFLREMEAEGVRVQIRTGEADEAKKEEAPQSLGEALLALVQGEEEIRHPWLRRLLEKEEEPKLPVPRVPKWWWVPRTVVIVVALVVAFLGTKLVFWLRGSNALHDSWDILAPLWGVTLGIVFEGLKALYEKRERLAEASWVLRGYTRVDDLARRERVLADKVVRQQSAAMLRALADALNEMRSQAFRADRTDEALRLKAVASDAERLAEDVQRPDFGRPPYVDSALRISRHGWNKMLDDDEDLLIQLDQLLRKMRNMQEKFHTGKSWESMLTEIEQGLADFRLQFARRSEALRPQQKKA